jgi:Protein of unknown function (DUF4232)
MVHSSDQHDHVEALLAEAKDRGRRRRTRRRHAALGGGVAVLLLGIMAAVVITRSPAGTELNVVGPSTPYPASSSLPATTLPPAPGTSPSPTAVPATTPPCRAGDLQAQGSWQGAGGSMAGGISLVNGGTGSCYVEGQPTVELFDQHGQRLSVVVSQTSPPTSQAPRVLLAPHSRPASVLVQWFNWCGSDPGPVVARVSLPSWAEPIAVAPPIGLIPRCNNAASPSTLDVGNFTQG